MKKLVLLSLSLVAVAASSQVEARYATACPAVKDECPVACPPARIIQGDTVSSQCPSYKLIPECVQFEQAKLCPAKLCPEKCNPSCYKKECVQLEKECVRL